MNKTTSITTVKEKKALLTTPARMLAIFLSVVLCSSLLITAAPTQAFAAEKNIGDLSISVEPIPWQIANTFDGATPKPIVKDNGVLLVEGTDYELSYRDNWCISYNPRETPEGGTEPGAYVLYDGLTRTERYFEARGSNIASGTLTEAFHAPTVIITGINAYAGSIERPFEITLRFTPGQTNIRDAQDVQAATTAPYWSPKYADGTDVDTFDPGKRYMGSAPGIIVYSWIKAGTFDTITNDLVTAGRLSVTGSNMWMTNSGPDLHLNNQYTNPGTYPYGNTGVKASYVTDPTMPLRDIDGKLVFNCYDNALKPNVFDDEGNLVATKIDPKTMQEVSIEIGNGPTNPYAGTVGSYYTWTWAGERNARTGANGQLRGTFASVKIENDEKVVHPRWWRPLYTGKAIEPSFFFKSAAFSGSGLSATPTAIENALTGTQFAYQQDSEDNGFKAIYAATYDANGTAANDVLGDNIVVSDPVPEGDATGLLNWSANNKRVGLTYFFSGPLVYGPAVATTDQSFLIVQRSIDNAVPTSDSTGYYDDLGLEIDYGIAAEYEYVGKPVTPEPLLSMVKPADESFEGYPLPETDYVVDAYADNNEPGTGKMTISAAPRTYTGTLGDGSTPDPATAIGGNLTGTVEVPFNIVAAKTFDIDAPTSLTFTGDALTPDITIKDVYGTPLVKDVDYTLTYKNNTEPGKATIEIKGNGVYSALDETITFDIKEPDPIDPPAPPTPVDPEDKDPVRLYGSDRYETAKNIILSSFDAATTDTVVVSTGEVFADALTVAGFAGIKDAPIILTSATTLNAHAKEAIQTLKPTHIYVTGGSAAISDAVYSELATMIPAGGTIARLAGNNRAETAIKIFEEGQGSWSKTAVIANGQNFPDALSVSPYVYDVLSPIFLSDPGAGLDSATLQALSSGGFDKIVIVGGSAAVPDIVTTQIQGAVSSSSVERWSGDNRYQTSVFIAEKAIGDSASSLSYNGAVLATGAKFPDALAGAAFAAREGTVLLLIDDSTEGMHAINYFITTYKAAIGQVTILGGESAVSKALEDAASKAYR